MKTVIDAAGNLYGPFGAVSQENGALHCTGDHGDVVLPLEVIGPGWQVVDGAPPSAANGFAYVAGAFVPRPDGEETIAGVTAAVQQRLDAFAQTRGYDSMERLITYAGDPDAQFSAEGTYGKTARSQQWAASRQIQQDVQAGRRPVPTVAQVISELPAMAWPQ
jgi:hypothetical protein